MGNFRNLTGQIFGKLKVLNYFHKNGRIYWRCKCDCGNITNVRGDRLLDGNTKSCGCLQKEVVRKLNTIHNDSHTRLYDIWTDMKQRCYNQHNKRYKDYGARGIAVCDEWKNDYSTFKEWALSNSYNDTLTIDRINNNSNYEPNNCRFVDAKTQVRNRRNTKYMTYKGITKPFAEWCEEYNLNYSTVYNRIYNCGWSIEKALELEV